MGCVCPAGTLAKLLGRMVTNDAISGTASTVMFVKLPLLTKLSALEELSPGERIGCTELVDQAILGCVDVVDCCVTGIGTAEPEGDGDGEGPATKAKDAAKMASTAIAESPIHLM